MKILPLKENQDAVFKNAKEQLDSIVKPYADKYGVYGVLMVFPGKNNEPPKYRVYVEIPTPDKLTGYSIIYMSDEYFYQDQIPKSVAEEINFAIRLYLRQHYVRPINEVYPNKGESKKDFIARFMSVTKDEYPDVKQRYAVANSYWDRRNKR